MSKTNKPTSTDATLKIELAYLFARIAGFRPERSVPARKPKAKAKKRAVPKSKAKRSRQSASRQSA